MTKMKSKKMTKSTFAVIIMAIVMVAMLAFGGTYAYFSDKTGDLAGTDFKAGKIVLNETGTKFVTENVVRNNLLPSEKLFGDDGTTITIQDDSNREAYIFVTFDITMTKDSATADDSLFTVAGLSGTTAYTVTAGSAQAGTLKQLGTSDVYYIETTEAAAGSTYVISGLNATFDKDAGNEWQEADIKITVEVKIIQQAGFDGNVQTAYDSIA